MSEASKQSLTWEVKKRGQGTLVVFQGQVDETADFSNLEGLAGSVTFDLGGVTRLNSEGVRRWINFVRAIDAAVQELAFVRCSVPVVTQINMIRGFAGKGKVRSFFAPYVCEDTGEEEERLLMVDDIADPTDPPTFEVEGGTAELDDIPERYLGFINDMRG